MPRDGSNIYHRPAGTDGVPNFPIESSKYNAYVADVEQDLNLPRPIVAGGSGANNATDALFNVKGEMATQIVTNWDSQVWVPGSFYAASTATGAAPVAGHAFAGVCYIGEALTNPPTNQNVVIEARDLDYTPQPGPLYVRQMKAGVWSAWGGGGGVENALAYSGMQINGSMEISQELGTSGTAINAKYALDGYRLHYSGTMVCTAQQAASSISGFPNCLAITVTTAQASMGANDSILIMAPIEGYRIERLCWGKAEAQSMTIGFWSWHSRSGIYGGSVRNSAATRTCAFSYVQAVANTPQFNRVTIPGCTDGTWNSDNNVGMLVSFTAASGTTNIAPTSGTWYNTSYLTGPGQTNGIASTSDFFRITGVVLLSGALTLTAAQSPLLMRPYDQELVTCKRYWQRLDIGDAIGGVVNATTIFANVVFQTQMRAVPIYAPSSTNTFFVTGAGNAFSGTGGSLNLASVSGAEIQVGGFTGLTPLGSTCLWRSSTGLIPAFDARF